MITKVTGVPTLTITGTDYSADVPVATFDDKGWIDNSTTLTVTGALTDTGAAFLTKLKAASSTWVATLATMETMQAKLNTLVGKVL